MRVQSNHSFHWNLAIADKSHSAVASSPQSPHFNYCILFFVQSAIEQVFIKSELKVGVIYVKEDQFTEEQILDNNENSPMFDEFLQVLGDKNRLRGFDKYKGGLDTVHDLTGERCSL